MTDYSLPGRQNGLNKISISDLFFESVRLLSETFRIKSNDTDGFVSRRSLANVLQTKTLVCHTLIMIVRLFLVGLDLAHW